MSLETELDGLLRPPTWVKITTAKTPTWRLRSDSADNFEGLEIKYTNQGTKGELVSFWFKDDERRYGLPASEHVQAILDQMQEKPKQETPKAANEEKSVMMPERLTEGIVEKLAKLSFPARLMHFQNTAPQYVKHRPGRAGEDYAFVEGHYMHQVLNLVSSFSWESYVDGWKETEKEVICWGKIVVNGISKSAVGQADIHFRKDGKGHLCLGDDYKAAHTDMEKKAASKFGIAIDVYRGEV